MVFLNGNFKDSTLEPGNHIATSIPSAIDLCPFYPKFDREHLSPMGSPYIYIYIYIYITFWSPEIVFLLSSALDL
jgi:hypothetical protein